MDRRVVLSFVMPLSVGCPSLGLAQAPVPPIPAAVMPGQPAPAAVLQGTLVSQSPPANLAPVPTPWRVVAPVNQLPLPLPLRSAANEPPADLQNAGALQPPPATAKLPQPNPPPIPPADQPAKEPAKPIKEPMERFVNSEGVGKFPDAAFGTGHWCWTGWRYGPKVAPRWEYPGLGGGPGVTYPWGMPGYTGRNDEKSLDKACRLWGPAVPVYTPVQTPSTTKDPLFTGRNVSSPGLIYGWVGPFPASPRFKHYAVDVWAQPNVDLSTGRPDNDPGKVPGGSNDNKKPSTGTSPMTLSVRVPHPAAEVYVDGVKTTQTGLDRTFTSPDLEPGKDYRYELTVRWVDGGAPVERKKVVLGSSGQVIPLDFTAPDVIRAGN